MRGRRVARASIAGWHAPAGCFSLAMNRRLEKRSLKTARADCLCLEESDEVLGEGVVVGVADVALYKAKEGSHNRVVRLMLERGGEGQRY